MGAVDSQTVCVEPRNATSNQKASPCIVQVLRMWNSSGITVRENFIYLRKRSNKKDNAKKTEESDLRTNLKCLRFKEGVVPKTEVQGLTKVVQVLLLCRHEVQ